MTFVNPTNNLKKNLNTLKRIILKDNFCVYAEDNKQRIDENFITDPISTNRSKRCTLLTNE